MHINFKKIFLIFLATFFSTQMLAATSTILPERYVPKLNMTLRFLGLGTVELGRDWGIGENRVKPEKISKIVLLSALEKSLNVIDTAASYQMSEERIGHYIPRNRFNYLLITKAGEHSILAADPQCKIPNTDNSYCKKPAASYDFTRQAIFKDVEDSLQKLHMAQLDVVLLHLENKTAEEILKKGEALQALQDLKKAGKIRFIGVSVNGPAAKLAIDTNGIDVIELEYNLLNRTNEENIALAHEKGLAVIVRGGLGTGLLTPSVAQHITDPNLPYGAQVRALLQLTHNNYEQLTALALAFLYQNKNISSVIIGADHPQFLQKDIYFLRFHDLNLLAHAKELMDQFKTPKDFTEIMGEYYLRKNEEHF